MAGKITEYPNTATSLIATDLFDVSQDLGGGLFESRKLPYSNLLGQLNTDISNIYNADGIIGDALRSVDLNGNILNFFGGKIGINTSTPNAQLHINSNGVDRAFVVEGDGEVSLFQVTGNNGEIGIGSVLSSHRLHIANKAGYHPLAISDEAGVRFLQVTGGKQVAIGDTLTAAARVHIRSNAGGDVLRVDTDVNNNALFIGNVGQASSPSIPQIGFNAIPNAGEDVRFNVWTGGIVIGRDNSFVRRWNEMLAVQGGATFGNKIAIGDNTNWNNGINLDDSSYTGINWKLGSNIQLLSTATQQIQPSLVIRPYGDRLSIANLGGSYTLAEFLATGSSGHLALQVNKSLSPNSFKNSPTFKMMSLYNDSSDAGNPNYVENWMKFQNIAENTLGNFHLSVNDNITDIMHLKDSTQLTAEGHTVMKLLIHDGTTIVLKDVEVGAANSGGTGYRMLRVTN